MSKIVINGNIIGCDVVANPTIEEGETLDELETIQIDSTKYVIGEV